MSPLSSLTHALRSLWAYRLWTAIAVGATFCGTSALIAVVTLVNGLDTYMREDLGRRVLGLDEVVLEQSADGPPLTFDDVEWIRRQLPGVPLTASTTREGAVRAGPRESDATIHAVDAAYASVRGHAVVEGRMFSEVESREGAPVAVLGADVAGDLFGERGAIGQTVTVWRTPYRVVGVLARQDGALGVTAGRPVLVPLRSPVNGEVGPRDVVAQVVARADGEAAIEPTAAALRQAAGRRRALAGRSPDDVEVRTAAGALGFWNRISGLLMLTLPGLVGISLVVAAVVIMNVMLVSVTERTREIGIRRALGARARDVLRQFVFEACALSGVGALCGIAGGVAVAAALSWATPLGVRVAPWSLALALGLGLAVGVTSGVYPAYRASRITPVEALRHGV